MSISGDVKKAIVVSILNVYAKTGATVEQINKDFKEQTGEKLAPTRIEGEQYMNSLEEVYMDPTGRYSLFTYSPGEKVILEKRVNVKRSCTCHRPKNAE